MSRHPIVTQAIPQGYSYAVQLGQVHSGMGHCELCSSWGRQVVLGWVQVRAPRVEEVGSMEASLRLDAVASAGFRMSRSKMMDLIKAGTCGVAMVADRGIRRYIK